MEVATIHFDTKNSWNIGVGCLTKSIEYLLFLDNGKKFVMGTNEANTDTLIWEKEYRWEMESAWTKIVNFQKKCKTGKVELSAVNPDP